MSLSCDTLSKNISQLSQYSNLSDDDRFLYKADVKSITEISSLTSSEEGEDDLNAFLFLLDELLARIMVLRVKVQLSYNQSSVIRLSEDPNLTKKVFDQIKVFEFVSMTADHDPKSFQVVTPSKRLSAELDLDLLQSPVYNSIQL
ncbi:hypothetical protein Lal_00002485 [Lupinus albus]|nr:hypothetical protein Lal_00002485 [Lupinus albus]